MTDEQPAAGKPQKKKTGVKPGTKKPDRVIDWVEIEQLYRAGILKIVDIAKKHGITHVAIVQRAKKNGWTRDIAEEARRLAAEKLASDKTPRSPKATPPADKGQGKDGKRPDPELPDGWTPPQRQEPDPPAEDPTERAPPIPHSGVNFEEIVQQAAGTIVAVVRQHRGGLKRINGYAQDLMDRLEGLMPNVRTMGHTYDAAVLLETLSRTYERIVKLERQAFGVDDPTIKHQHTGADGNALPAGVSLEVLKDDELFSLRGIADAMARRRSHKGSG